MVRYYERDDIENKISAILSEVRELKEASQQDLNDLQVLYKESKEIAEISKLGRITPRGIEMSSIYFRNWMDGTETASMTLNELSYNCIWNEEFSNSKDIAIKFRKRLIRFTIL